MQALPGVRLLPCRQDAEVDGRRNRFSPVVHAQFLVNVRRVALCCPFGDDQTLRDLLGAQPLGQERHDFEFAVGQRLDQIELDC